MTIMKPKRRHLSLEEFNRANDEFIMSVISQMSDELSEQRRKQTEQNNRTQNKDIKNTFVER
ncbi:MAG: hypothetical protein LBC20_07055 [Planctomycetaceae bacterium]|nr:hypothetical protein [Planctomycetaceae bacterium]